MDVVFLDVFLFFRFLVFFLIGVWCAPYRGGVSGAAAGSTRSVRVGHFGRIHPEVLANYKLALPVSSLELNLHELL